MNAYYFGCWSPQQIGHYLYDVNGRGERRGKDIPIRAEALDGSLLYRVPDKEGNAVLFHGRGWTLLSFWDRSGDSRPGSNSTFLMHGTFSFIDAANAARDAFPERWSRIKFAIVEYPS